MKQAAQARRELDVQEQSSSGPKAQPHTGTDGTAKPCSNTAVGGAAEVSTLGLYSSGFDADGVARTAEVDESDHEETLDNAEEEGDEADEADEEAERDRTAL